MPKKRSIKPKLNLDVGCGSNKQPGYVGMDKRPIDGVDIVHDAEVMPWPIDAGACAVVAASHLIEHIKPWLQIDFLNECWRVLEPAGVLFMVTPYATSFGYAQDPTHCSPWNEATVEYFLPDKPLYEIYRPKPWKLERLFFNPKYNIELAIRKAAENGKGAADGQKK